MGIRDSSRQIEWPRHLFQDPGFDPGLIGGRKRHKLDVDPWKRRDRGWSGAKRQFAVGIIQDRSSDGQRARHLWQAKAHDHVGSRQQEGR